MAASARAAMSFTALNRPTNRGGWTRATRSARGGPARVPATPVAVAVSTGPLQAVPPPAPPASISEAHVRMHDPTSLLAAAVMAAAAGAAAWQHSRVQQARRELHYPGLFGLVRTQSKGAASAEESNPEYRMALARTRLATAVHRAVGFLGCGARSRAWLELRRALHQYNICGSALHNSLHSKEQRAGLYRLLVEEMSGPGIDVAPLDLGVLLQLRALLDLELDHAEAVEEEVARSRSSASWESSEDERGPQRPVPTPARVQAPLLPPARVLPRPVNIVPLPVARDANAAAAFPRQRAGTAPLPLAAAS